MNETFLRIGVVLAQVAPWEDPPAASPEAPGPKMGFGDLQKALHAVNTGQTDQSFRNGAIVIIGVVVLLAVFLHNRQRRKTAGPPDSLSALARELSHHVAYPFGTRMLLWWVARGAGTPMATLLISSALFERAVGEWAAAPTFGLVRRWGKGRLERLKAVLFG
jgi:hypothetical protein